MKAIRIIEDEHRSITAAPMPRRSDRVHAEHVDGCDRFAELGAAVDAYRRARAAAAGRGAGCARTDLNTLAGGSREEESNE
jgi:hypothetical protein